MSYPRDREATTLQHLGQELCRKDRANDRIPPRETRLGLRLAMLQNPLPAGTAEELRWFVEETDALRRVRTGTSTADRAHLIAETRHWVMRDLRAWDGTAHERPPADGDLRRSTAPHSHHLGPQGDTA